MKNKLKKPSDYPQFYCRMKSEDKDEIESLIENIILMSEEIKEIKGEVDSLKLKRNYLIQRSLLAGLKAFEKKFELKLDKIKNRHT